MWSMTVGQCGTPIIYDEKGEYVATFKRVEIAKEVANQHNQLEPKNVSSLKPKSDDGWTSGWTSVVSWK